MSETAGTLQKLCPQCGGMTDTDARFCKHCAFDLSKSSLDYDATVITPKSKWKTNPNSIFWIVGVAFIGLPVLGLIGAYLYKRNSTQSNVATASPASIPTPAMSDKAKQVEDKIPRGETLTNSDLVGLSAYELRVLGQKTTFITYSLKTKLLTLERSEKTSIKGISAIRNRAEIEQRL